MSLLSTRLPHINGDKGNWGEILNGWLKSIGGYAGTGYGNPNNPFEANNAGLNFASSDPTPTDLGLAAIPTGFTYINTESNQIRRWTGSNWQILLAGGQDHDWYVTGGTSIPSNITQNIYTRGRVGIGDHFGTAAATQPGGHEHFLEVRSTHFPLGLYVSSDQPGQPSFVGLYRRRNSGNGSVQNGDLISGIYSFGYNGSSYEFLTLIQSVASVGNQLGASMIFATRSDNAGAVSERMRIHSNGFIGIARSNPVYMLDVGGTIRSYLAGFVSDHAYTFINGQFTPQSNSVPAAQCAYGGFLSLRHLGKTGSNEVYDWYWVNMKNVTNGNDPNVASGLHLVPYGYYTTLRGSPSNQIDNVRLVFSDNGRLGINTANPAHTLTVIIPSTSITGSYQVSGWQHSSDGRLKINVTPITNALEKVLQLRGVNFTWKNNPESGNQIGFIAQEVKQVVPELVSGTEGDIEKGETLSMSYGNVTPLLVEAIKEQQKIIADLQRRVALLESQQQNNI